MGKKRVKQLDALAVSAFCESMAMMLQSGIQTDEAVSLLRQGGAGDRGKPRPGNRHRSGGC